MKLAIEATLGALIVVALVAAPICRPVLAETKWEGVDKTVIEKFAEEAGHPAQAPYLNTDQGDLLLFLFLLAGAIGGFVAGYAYRGLFPPKPKVRANEISQR